MTESLKDATISLEQNPDPGSTITVRQLHHLTLRPGRHSDSRILGGLLCEVFNWSIGRIDSIDVGDRSVVSIRVGDRSR
jgi:hypothetical protein